MLIAYPDVELVVEEAPLESVTGELADEIWVVLEISSLVNSGETEDDTTALVSAV